MRRILVAPLLTASAIAPIAASSNRSSRSAARSEPRSAPRNAARPGQPRSAGTHARSKSSRCETCVRDANGRVKRDPAARRAFVRSHPCPATGKTTGACPGYVVDHVIPLKGGGADAPENMQWQTVAEARAKDGIE